MIYSFILFLEPESSRIKKTTPLFWIPQLAGRQTSQGRFRPKPTQMLCFLANSMYSAPAATCPWDRIKKNTRPFRWERIKKTTRPFLAPVVFLIRIKKTTFKYAAKCKGNVFPAGPANIFPLLCCNLRSFHAV